MNKTPSIFVDTGFEVDQNGALTEIVTPNVVAALNPPRKVTFNGTALNWIPSTSAALQEFEAPNMTEIPNSNICKGFTALQRVVFDSATSITCTNSTGGQFYGCTNLTSVSMPELTTIYCNALGYGGIFAGCTALTSVYMPNLTTINSPYGGPFIGCTGLTTITLPHLASVANADNGAFYNCTGLQSVQLGSDGSPVASIGNNLFKNCTQSGLTITIYTQGGAALSGAPWGATNATIVYEEA